VGGGNRGRGRGGERGAGKDMREEAVGTGWRRGTEEVGGEYTTEGGRKGEGEREEEEGQKGRRKGG